MTESARPRRAIGKQPAASVNGAACPKLWGGRFGEAMASIVEAYTSSIDADARLLRQDVAGVDRARAHARAAQRIITKKDADAIVRGLERDPRRVRGAATSCCGRNSKTST